MLNSWLRAANPFNAPRGMLEAQRAGQVMVFGLVASAVISAIMGILQALYPEWFQALTTDLYQDMGLRAQEIAQQQAIMSVLMPITVVVGVALVSVTYLVLAWAQWKYITRWIPLLLLALSGYGLLVTVLGRISGRYDDLPTAYLVLGGVSWTVKLISFILYAASLRGAWMFHRLKQEP